nr:glycoprotein C UL44 [Psittacid alphaherpesvirus 6]
MAPVSASFIALLLVSCVITPPLSEAFSFGISRVRRADGDVTTDASDDASSTTTVATDIDTTSETSTDTATVTDATDTTTTASTSTSAESTTTEAVTSETSTAGGTTTTSTTSDVTVVTILATETPTTTAATAAAVSVTDSTTTGITSATSASPSVVSATFSSIPVSATDSSSTSTESSASTTPTQSTTQTQSTTTTESTSTVVPSTTGATTTPSSTASSSTPVPTPAWPANVTCDRTLFYAKPNESITFECTVTTNPAYIEWREWLLEVYFRSTEFTPENVDGEAARIAGFPSATEPLNSYPSRVELIFSASRDDQGDVWLKQSDTRGKYNLHTRTANNVFALTVTDLGFDDDGIFDLVLRDKSHFPMVSTRVVLRMYKRPDTLDLVAPPTAVGARYGAVCTVRHYFPTQSLQIRWHVNGKPVEELLTPSKYSRNAFWWLEYPEGISLVSSLKLWEAKEAEAPPKITCVAEWRVENAAASCSSDVTPKMYRLPELSLTFREGYAVCDVVCPPKDVYVEWIINGEQQSSTSVITTPNGPCKTDPKKTNLRSRVRVYDTWAKVRYVCKLRGFPISVDGERLQVSKVLDSAPSARGTPIIAILMVVFGIAMAMGLIILTIALCMYKSSRGNMGKPRYTRF